jgi:hypothetical protein
LGRRSRKRSLADRPVAAAAPAPRAPRGEARNAAVREQLEPLRSGERPGAIVAAAATAAALALANLVLLIVGLKVDGRSPSLAGTLVFCALMLTAAVGIWRLRYWAVLGFQALLALIIIVFALFLLRASNVEAVVLCIAVVGLGGWLFWKLVRAMARIQMPQRGVQ